MYYVKTFLFLGFCFLLGVGLVNGISHFRGGKAEAFATPHTGIGNAPPLRGFALPLGEGTPAAITRVPWSQLHATAVTVAYPATGSAGKALKESVAAAHKQGMQLVLLPAAVFAAGNPYPQSLEKIAGEAQAAHVDALCISWLNVELGAETLARQTAAARKAYSGKLILAATAEVLCAMESFEDVDEIAAIGPVRLPQRLPHASADIDLNAVRVFWDSVLGSLESRATKGAKPLLLVNAMVPQTVQACLPLPGAGMNTTPNPELQEMTYEALLMETKGRANVEGLFLPWSPLNTEADTTAVNRFPELVKKMADLWSSSTPMPPATSEPAADTETSFDGFAPLEN